MVISKYFDINIYIKLFLGVMDFGREFFVSA